MIARNKPAVRIDIGTEPPPPGRNRRNLVRVHASYRAVLCRWAFRPRLIETFNTVVLRELIKLSSDPKLEAVEISVTYDQESLGDAAIRVSIASIDGHEPKIITTIKGMQTFIVKVPAELHTITPADREEALKKRLWQFRRPFQSALERVYLGEDLGD